MQVATALALTLVAGCSWAGSDDGRDHDPANQPGYALPHDATTAPAQHVVAGTAHGITGQATFELVNGADVVQVVSRDLGGDLYRISTPENAKVAPTADLDGSTVVAGTRSTGLAGPAVVTVELSTGLLWNVRLAGGATDESVDLANAPHGGNVDFAAGTSRAEVTLPAAGGTQRVTMSGGASQFTVHLNGPAPVRVAATGGAGAVTVDGDIHSGVGAGSIWTPDGWSTATSRYDIDATAGVSTLTVDRS